jgi:hypothetical protein
MSGKGWCIEKGCLCTDMECGPNGIPENECASYFPGGMCIVDISQDPAVELCTIHCMSNSDCPIGFWCDTGGGVTTPFCRCHAAPSP